MSCYSSEMTEELAAISSPVVVEFGSLGLCVISSIETAAASVFFLASGCSDFGRKYLSSSAFTFLWNLGTVLVFNPGCNKLWKHESEARCKMRTELRAQVFQMALGVMAVASAFFCPYKAVTVGLLALTVMTSLDWRRPEDTGRMLADLVSQPHQKKRIYAN